jgi:hypothetical protein
MSYDGATIEVVNWDKYNPRTDSKKPSWFRFENTIATGPSFFGLDAEQKWLWVFILSLVSQANGAGVVWNSAYAQQLTGVKPKKQDETIEIFEKFARLRVSREVTERVSPATNERTDERTGGLRPDDLRKIWNNFRGNLPEVKTLSPDRIKKIKARLEEEPSQEYWTRVLGKIRASAFLSGRETKWKCTFDWLIENSTNHVKIAEGNYDSRTPTSSAPLKGLADLEAS